MRFPSPLPSISPTARSFALLAFALVMFGLGGACEDKHIGRTCELGTPMGGTSGSTAIVSSPALECPSRICILPPAETGNTANTGPLCTASCESNEDCEDGEGGPKGDAVDRHCETGFTCMWPTTVGDFKCQKFCVCRDFVSEPAGGWRKPPPPLCP